MTTRTLGLAIALVASLAMVATGCGDDPEGNGSLDVGWAIGGSTCNQSGVSTIKVSLYADGQLVTEAEFPCPDGTGSIPDVPPGNYTVRVDGFGTSGESPIFTGMKADVDVPEGSAGSAGQVALSASTGALDLQWRFANGQICHFAGVEWLKITVWDDNSVKVAEEELACNPAVTERPTPPAGSEYLAEADGKLLDGMFSGTYSVFVLAFANAESTEPMFWADAEPTVTPASLTDVDLVLRACEGGDADPCK